MRFVDEPVIRPNRCAVLPQVHGYNATGWIDTGAEMPGFDNHIYVSVQGAEELARFVGWHPSSTVDELQGALSEADRRIADLEDELAEADKQLQAYDTLKSRPVRHVEEAA